MSWGLKVILSFGVFAAGIMVLVVISMSKNTDLVSENYYEQEIKYQEQISILENSKKLNEETSVSIEDKNIKIKFPNKLPKRIRGDIHFYRNENKKLDFNTEFNPDENGIQKIPEAEMQRGVWILKISLQSDTNRYYIEKKIFLE